MDFLKWLSPATLLSNLSSLPTFLTKLPHLPEYAYNLSKTIAKAMTLKEPHSKNWGFRMNLATKVLKANNILAPDFSIDYVQTITSYCKDLPSSGLEIQRTTVPNEFREQAYQFFKSYMEKRHGRYLLPDSDHWKLSKPLDIQWLTVNNRPDSNPKSVIYYIHGGGYALGHSCLYNHLYADLSEISNSEILTIDYRLGPQYTIFSMIEDVLAAYFYLLAPESKGGKGLNNSQVVVGGESAGGGLTSNLIHILRNAKQSQPAGAFLWSPSPDLSFSQPSMKENLAQDALWDSIDPPIVVGNNGLLLNSTFYLWMYNGSPQAVKDRMSKDGTPLGPKEAVFWSEISPMLDSDMDNLPPTLIFVGEREALRDSGIVYGKRRAEAEKKSLHKHKHKRTIIPNVETIVYEDMVHVFMIFKGNERCTGAVKTTSEFIYQALNANNQSKLSAKQYQYLPNYKKAYMNTTYNMYWNDIHSQTIPWESPYKVSPFPLATNSIKPSIIGNRLT